MSTCVSTAYVCADGLGDLVDLLRSDDLRVEFLLIEVVVRLFIDALALSCRLMQRL